MQSIYNIKFYTLCRHKISTAKSDIYSEINSIFNASSISYEKNLTNWINEYETYTDKDQLIDSTFICYLLDLNSSDSRIIQKMKFYSICRMRLLNSTLTKESIQNEINLLFEENDQFKSWLQTQTESHLCELNKIQINKLLLAYQELYSEVDRSKKLETELKDVQQELKKAQDKIKCLENEKENSEEFLKHLKKIVQTNTEKLKQKNNKIAQLECENKQLYETINQDLKCKRLQDEINSLKNDLERNQLELIEATSKIPSNPNRDNQFDLETYKKEIEFLNDLNLKNQKQISCLNEINLTLEEELIETKNKMNQNEKQMKILQDILKSTTFKLTNLEKEKDAQTTEFNKKIYKQITDNNELKSKCTNQKNELAKLNLKIAKITKENNELKNSKIQKTLKDRHCQTNFCEKKIEIKNIELQTSFKDANDDVDIQTIELELKFKHELLILSKEIETLNSSLKKKSDVIKQLQEKSNRLEIEIMEMKLENKKFKHDESDIIVLDDDDDGNQNNVFKEIQSSLINSSCKRTNKFCKYDCNPSKKPCI